MTQLSGRTVVQPDTREVVMETLAIDVLKVVLARRGTAFLSVQADVLHPVLGFAFPIAVEPSGEVIFVADCAYKELTVPFRGFVDDAVSRRLAKDSLSLVRALMAHPKGQLARELDVYLERHR
jgi:hypothetical protein